RRKKKPRRPRPRRKRRRSSAGCGFAVRRMKAIVGLGNPGSRYKGTRHNVGFEVVERLAARHGLLAFEQAPADAVLARWRPDAGEPVLFVKPTTFMNLSGQAVGDIVRYFRVDVESVLVVLDEIQ